MITIIPAQKLKWVFYTASFAGNEQLLVCLVEGQGRAVIMGLEQYFRMREWQGKGGKARGSKRVHQGTSARRTARNSTGVHQNAS